MSESPKSNVNNPYKGASSTNHGWNVEAMGGNGWLTANIKKHL